jgi:hypothetical protein
LNDTTNASYAQANTARTTANDAYGQANTARDQANTARTQANTAYDQANNARGQANTAYGQANAAYDQANASYNVANTKLASAGGTLSGDLIITGNLTVSGNSTTLNTEILTVEDAEVVLLSNVASTPALNAGVIVNRGTSANTFLRWDEALDEWGWSDSGNTTYYFEDLRAGLATTNTTFGTVNTSLGTINTSYQAAYAQANTAGTNALNAYGAANNRVLKAGDTMTGNLTMSGATLNTATANITTIVTGNTLTLSTGTASNSNVVITANGTEYVRVTNTGNVGIGTTNPHSARLHVAGINTNPNLSATAVINAAAVIGNEDREYGTYFATYGSGDGAIQQRRGGSAVYYNLLLQPHGGSVGIGTTTPNATVQIYSSNTTPALLRLETPGNSLNTVFWMEDYDTNVAAKAVATMDLSTGLGLFNLYAGAYTASGGNYYGSTRGASRIGMHDNAINFYTANAASAGHSTGTAVTWYQTLQSSNANFIVYTNNATERLRVDANGNVGIGTASASTPFHVYRSDSTDVNPRFESATGQARLRMLAGSGATNRATGIDFLNGVSSTTAPRWSILNDYNQNGTNDLSFVSQTGSDIRMVMLQSGNVGIGTTSPQAKQHNYISSRSTAFSAGDGTTWHDLIIQNPNNTQSAAVGIAFELNSSYHSNAGTGIAAVKSTASSDYGADMVFVTRPQSAGAAECMRITSGGNIGIANTAPAVRLQIGNLSSVSTSSPETVSLGATFSSSAGGNPKLRVWTDGTNTIGLGVSSNQFDFIATGAYSHVFYQNGSERMRIDTSGHLVPGANATYNLGSTSLRWSTVYTSDLDLSNGIGDWTIVEGEDDLFIYNNKRNKVYKFKLEEVDPATAVPKKENL